MRKMLITICLMVGIVLVQGCCTLISGTTQRVTVHSNPPGACVTAENGQLVITPGILSLERGKSHLLTAKAEGYSKQTYPIHRQFNPIFLTNIWWGAGFLIAGPIDIISGAAWKLTPDTVYIHMAKIED